MSKQSVPEKMGARRGRTRPAPSRALRGAELHREQCREIRQTENGFWSVPSCSGRKPYVVDLESESCTCPDWREHRKACKHVFAAVAKLVCSRHARASSGSLDQARERRAGEVARKIAEDPPRRPTLYDCRKSYNLFLTACALYPYDGPIVDAARKRHRATLAAHDEAVALELGRVGSG